MKFFETPNYFFESLWVKHKVGEEFS